MFNSPMFSAFNTESGVVGLGSSRANNVDIFCRVRNGDCKVETQDAVLARSLSYHLFKIESNEHE
jgi:hypothetical protein